MKKRIGVRKADKFLLTTKRLHKAVGARIPPATVLARARKAFAYEVKLINLGLIDGHRISSREISLLLSRKEAPVEQVSAIAEKFPRGAYPYLHEKFYKFLDVLPNVENLMDCFSTIVIRNALRKRAKK